MSWESSNARIRNAGRQAEEFNRDHPVGSRVRYYPIRRRAEHLDTETTSPAWALPSGYAVVSVRGISGGVSLDHIEVLTEVRTT